MNSVIDQWPEAPVNFPQALRTEFLARRGKGQVGSRLVSETDKMRIWHLALAPGERIGFHTHVLDYFWTAVTPGRARSHYGDGKVVDVEYGVGDTKHHVYGPGEYMIHDLENTGDTTLMFTTVEFKNSANRPLELELTDADGK